MSNYGTGSIGSQGFPSSITNLQALQQQVCISKLETERAEWEAMKRGQSTKPAGLDEAVKAIYDEVLRYENKLNHLICKLEVPRPTNETCGVPSCSPGTIFEALGDIHIKLFSVNETLQQTINRINEQIGELKLLP